MKKTRKNKKKEVMEAVESLLANLSDRKECECGIGEYELNSEISPSGLSEDGTFVFILGKGDDITPPFRKVRGKFRIDILSVEDVK